jgi:class 3 adenylate cyclase
MDPQAEVKHLREALKQSEHVQYELDRRVFYLKTLYDVSKDIFSSVESETILRSFLLMAMGNFGTAEGFIALMNTAINEIQHFVELGLKDRDVTRVKYGIEQLNRQGIDSKSMTAAEEVFQAEFLSAEFAFTRGFTVEAEWAGIVGLGSRLIGEPYTENDWELLDTLVNNLVVALKNARSFEKIKKLNLDLESKNLALKKALEELQAALRKVEILESIKLNLCKFVPTVVTRMVEKSPTAEIQDARERDISVLFLDIEGYTKITECVGGTEVHTLIEKYFSVFMDAIYENNGDVVETAGDGLMVLFLSDGEAQHALEAVKTAQTIKEKARLINDECSLDSQPLVVNIGICSGHAFVGAAKFESYTGSRWAYTSHGTTTNVAARLCGHAKGGEVLVSKTTADRVKSHFSFSALGKFSLKNLTEEVDIYALQD